MDWLPPLLPSTVIVAIGLFVLKEVLEGIRRIGAQRRQLAAFKTLLARECELNHWTIEKLKNALDSMEGDSEQNLASNYFVKHTKSGKVIFEDDDGSSWPLTQARSGVMSEVMFDVATLDRELFSLLQDAYDSVLELDHVRQSLIDYLETDDENERVHLSAFPDYGLRVLEDVRSDLEKLYLECTGSKLEIARLR